MINGKRPDWFLDWQGECAAVIGAGPSLTKADVEKLRERIHVIAVNTSYKLCPWADALYSCDANWWEQNQGAKDFPGLKIGFDYDGRLRFPDVRRIKIKGRLHHWVNEIVMDEDGQIGAGANSAYQACNIAAQFGATAILLLGLDMMDDARKSAHWHGKHRWPLHNPIQSNFDKWIENFRNAAPTFQKLGIDVVNCTARSALQGYPQMSIEEAFKRWSL
jgi:hypothetical protein